MSADDGSSGSCPATAFSVSARSPTVRASGPEWSSVHASGITPRRLTRPYVGLSPATPQSDAGMRIDPPVSLPGEKKQKPDATATALPPLEPPGMRVVSQGLHAGPKCGF